MARSKKKRSARAKAASTAAASETERLEELPEDREATDAPDDTKAKTADDKGKGDKESAGKDPVRRKRTPTSAATGELGQKAKDADRSATPKKSAAAEGTRRGRRVAAASQMNPSWLAPTAVVLLLVGLAYLVTYYLSAGTLPLPIGDWNLAAGFGVMLLGGGMLMFWK